MGTILCPAWHTIAERFFGVFHWSLTWTWNISGGSEIQEWKIKKSELLETAVNFIHPGTDF